jgi:hypothetical protein
LAWSFSLWVNSPAALPIISAGLHQERENVIELEVSSCHGDLKVSKVETDDEIEVLVRQSIPDSPVRE